MPKQMTGCEQLKSSKLCSAINSCKWNGEKCQYKDLQTNFIPGAGQGLADCASQHGNEEACNATMGCAYDGGACVGSDIVSIANPSKTSATSAANNYTGDYTGMLAAAQHFIDTAKRAQGGAATGGGWGSGKMIGGGWGDGAIASLTTAPSASPRWPPAATSGAGAQPGHIIHHQYACVPPPGSVAPTIFACQPSECLFDHCEVLPLQSCGMAGSLCEVSGQQCQPAKKAYTVISSKSNPDEFKKAVYEAMQNDTLGANPYMDPSKCSA